MKDCCATMPEPKAQAKDCEDCKTKEKAEKWCCMTDCRLKALEMLNSTGFLDAELMKAKMGELVDKNEAWVKAIDDVVTECFKEGKK